MRPAACLLLTACSVSGAVGTVVAETESEATTASTGPDDATTLPPSDALLDVGPELDLCQAFGGQEEFAPCTLMGLQESFDPEVQWSWSGQGELRHSYVTPMVANLDDDNDSGRIDLCDTPDVVVVASPLQDNLSLSEEVARIFVLAGRDGTVLAEMGDVLPGYAPALGDVDRDGTVEIVTVQDAVADPETRRGRIVIFRGDGTILTQGASTFARDGVGAVALADLEGDGAVEIIVDHEVMDADGNALFRTDVRAAGPQLPVAADLDGDGVLEVLWGHQFKRADGTGMFTPYDWSGYPHVANFDDDAEPEVFVSTSRGLILLDARGAILDSDETPDYMGLDRVEADGWRRPAAIHDIYGDSRPEIAMSAGDYFVAIDWGPSRGFHIQWLSDDITPASAAAATAFDFLGDGEAEAVYGDKQWLWVFDLLGNAEFKRDRTSITSLEFPIVVDVDNDGSAEIVAVSNEGTPLVQVWEASSDGWVPARRIWNQHTYHVTNIEEDGTVPAREVPAYRRLNTFRTNVQIEGGLICDPEP